MLHGKWGVWNEKICITKVQLTWIRHLKTSRYNFMWHGQKYTYGNLLNYVYWIGLIMNSSKIKETWLWSTPVYEDDKIHTCTLANWNMHTYVYVCTRECSMSYIYIYVCVCVREREAFKTVVLCHVRMITPCVQLLTYVVCHVRSIWNCEYIFVYGC